MQYETIVEHVARTLWLCAYADGIEDGIISGPRPGGGEDWNAYAPDTPWEAKGKASALVQNIPSPLTMCDTWTNATGLDVERFGHCLALQALGHGVGLSDDVPYGVDYTRPDLPSMEFHIWNVNELPDGVEWTYLASEAVARAWARRHGYIGSSPAG